MMHFFLSLSRFVSAMSSPSWQSRSLGQRGIFLALALGVFLTGLALSAAAQTPQVPQGGSAQVPVPAVATPPPQPPLQGEVGPELYLLRDKQGKLQAVPGFSFEDFMELYRLKKRLTGGDERPRYIVNQCLMTGGVRGKVVALSVVLTIELNDPNWVRIPLGLAHVFAEGAAKIDGPGEAVLEFTGAPTIDANAKPTAQGDGYVLWIKGEPRKPLKVTIPIVVPVTTVGGETLLRLESPRATSAQLVVEVPLAGVVARVSEGATLLEPAVAPNHTTFSVVGASGLVELAWRLPGSDTAATPAVLEASGSTIAKIDGRRVGFESRLSVRSFSGVFDRFRVRLPPGATLIGSSPASVNVSAVTPDGTAKEAGNLIEVRLDKKTTGPVEIRLMADRPRVAENTEETLELAGFELIGAVRQWGTIGVQVVGNWQVVWAEGNGVRRVNDVPSEFKSEDLVGTFEYSIQPCSLTARVMPRRTRVSVQPRYSVTVGANEARLSADLKYTIRGAKVRTLTVEMPGWEIDEIGPPTLVNVDAAAIEDTSRFSIPLMQPANGDLSLTITARRRLPQDKNGRPPGAIALDLPRPEADVIAAALLVVQPEDNVELSPQSEKLIGLSLRPTRHVGTPLNMQQDPLVYQVEDKNARFMADFKVNPQVVKAEMQATVQVDERELTVEQRVQYSILHEPVDRLVLMVPRTVPWKDVTFTVDNNLLRPIVREPVASTTSSSGDSATVTVPLGTSRIGSFELICRYRTPLEPLPTATSVAIPVALVVPVGATLGKNTAQIRTAAGIVAVLRKGAWVSEDTADRRQAVGDGLRIWSNAPTESIPLALTQKDRSQLPTTLVERGLIQSRMVESGRQDYMALQVLTGERRLQLELPAGLDAKDLQVSVNGIPSSLDAESNGKYFVSLPTTGTSGRHLLELYYQIQHSGSTGWNILDVPRLIPAAWNRQLYWQVIVPGHEHLLMSSANYTTESRWHWNGWYWNRVAVRDSAALARWLGIRPDRLTVPTTANCYLFGTAGDFQALSIFTARRASLVFASSLVVLFLGLGLIYRPALRSVGLLLTAAVGLLVLGLLTPDLSVLVGQSALLGAGLIALAILLRRFTSSGRAQSSLVAEDLSLTTDTFDRGTELFDHADIEPPKSTATAPSMLPVASAEGVP